MELHIPFRSQRRLPCAFLCYTIAFSTPLCGYAQKRFLHTLHIQAATFKLIHPNTQFPMSLHEKKLAKLRLFYFLCRLILSCFCVFIRQSFFLCVCSENLS